ncbi:MAG TPA: alpha/beta fold hydrolase, partial [Mycobacterium sp.]|nr:alpha/beta fold hydrolase [Mycobacterium sp.]
MSTAVRHHTSDGRVDVVFLHGWLMGPYMWEAQTAALRRVARCHALAQPGHGGAPLNPEASMADWAEWLIDHIDARGIDRAVFVGHAMGGLLVQELWRRHPDRVSGLALVSIT